MSEVNLLLCPGCMRKLKEGENVCPSCGWDLSARYNPEETLPEGTVLFRKYLIGRVLGQGGFGITYLGYDLDLAIKVAIKEYFPTGYCKRASRSYNVMTIKKDGETGFFSKGCEAFLDEARTLAQFNSPSIVHVRDFFREHETAYIVMDFVEGVTLKDEIKRYGRLPVNRILTLMEPLIRQLGKLHEKNIIHRDIKPENLMIVTDGDEERIVLLDFGAARYFASDHTKTMTGVVTHGFAPLEQYSQRSRQGPYTDVYALCAAIYNAISGTVPPSATERIAADLPIESFSAFGVTVPEHVEKAIMHGLELKSEERTQTMEQLQKELKGSSSQPVQPQPQEHNERKESKDEKQIVRSHIKDTKEKIKETDTDTGKTIDSQLERKLNDKKEEHGKKNYIPVIAAAVTLLLIAGIAVWLFMRPKAPENFRVSWVNEDGTILETDEKVKQGETPEYNGKTPEKAEDEAFTYQFSSWYPEISEVTGDVTYRALYTAVAVTPTPMPTPIPTATPTPTYTVNWVNEDGTILEIDEKVKQGETPEYNGKTPEKAEDEAFTYQFSSWYPEISEVTGDVTYRALYKAVAVTEEPVSTPTSTPTYTIIWMDADGNTIDSEEVSAGTIPSHEALTKEADEQYTYTFSRWIPEISPVSGNIAYQAAFDKTPRKYNITWMDPDGTVYDVDSVYYNSTPVHADPVKEADEQYTYTFSDWTPEIVPATGDTIYQATFNKSRRKYMITWLDEDGKLIDTTELRYGTFPGHTELENKADEKNEYRFSGWIPEIKRVEENTTYKAVYERIPWESVYKYIILNGNAVITEYIGKGGKVTIPQALGGAPVNNIKEYLFTEKNDITAIVISEGIEQICEGAFWGNDLQEIYLPSTLKTIGYNAFWNHDRLKEIHLDSNNQFFVLEDGVLFNKDKSALYLYPSYRPLQTTYDIPEGVKRIEAGAFSDATFLKNVSLPNSLETIEDCAFWGCTRLKEIRIPAGVKRMGYCCFFGLPNKTKVYIPPTVKNIDNDAFGDSKDRITIEGEKGSYAEKYASRNGIKFVEMKTASNIASESDILNTQIQTPAPDDKYAVGSYVTFGHYPKTSEGNDNTPIEWLVLAREGNKALLLSRYGLDAQPYNKKFTSITWEKCTLRTWLNGTFLKKAFTAQEQAGILLTKVDNSNSQGYSGWSTGGNDTQDKIFLLSYVEANKYLGLMHGEINMVSRVSPTAYAIKQGAYTSNNIFMTVDGEATEWWWLRSPGRDRYNAARASRDGSLSYYVVNYDGGCVRPALWINLESDIF